MSSQGNDLKAKLVDRSSLLKERLQYQRVAGPSQKERETTLKNFRKDGADMVYQKFCADHEKVAHRMIETLGEEAAAEREVRPAIAFASNIISLDLALGGGFPVGMIEIYGAENVGKTTLVTDLIQSAQSQELNTGLCVGEYFDHARMKYIGVDLAKLVLFRGLHGEDILEAAGEFLLDGDHRVVFMDTATALRPSNDQYGNWWMMILAWITWVAPKLGPHSCVVMANQVRVKRSVDPKRFFAGRTDSTAWRIANYFNTRMELSRDSVTETTYDLIINIVANLLSAPAKFVSLPVVKCKGIDVWRDVVRVASDMGILIQKGSWYYIASSNELLGQGEEIVARNLEKAQGVRVQVFNQTLQAFRGVNAS